jgi:xanthine dehydrogenase small subunit
MSDVLRMALNGQAVTLPGIAASTTLLDWLRQNQRLTGTKEGCAEGDCGACTVVLEELKDGLIQRRAINSCLMMIGQADGCGIRTVEGLSLDGELHPVQRAYAAGGGTQCGFCTPGFVMSTYTYAAQGGDSDVTSIHDALAGNLCRCTGYRPIVQAVLDSLVMPDVSGELDTTKLVAALRAVERTSSASFAGDTFASDSRVFHTPRLMEEALHLRQKFPDARILSGGTDLGLLVSRDRAKLPNVIHIGKVDALRQLTERRSEIEVGAAVTYSDAFEFLSGFFPGLKVYLSRLGSRQIRNLGTIGGNVGTASPIGDFLPILLCLSARIQLRSLARGIREVAADDFFTGYRTTALQPDELIQAIIIPKVGADVLFRVDKISKRRDQDISTICSAFLVKLQDGRVENARLAFGGMAVTPKRALSAEAALKGELFDELAIARAGVALASEFYPISDCRGSADYRLRVAQNLLRRFYVSATRQAVTLALDALQVDLQ